MDATITLGNCTIAVTGVDEDGAVFSPNFPSQLAQIEDALTRIPAVHQPYVPTISVGSRPAAGGAFYRSPPRIGLARTTFVADHNINVLFTLLHECGHAVDRETHAVSHFAHDCGGNLVNGAPGNADWDAYRAIVYRGRNRRADGTPQFGEHFAEGYAIFLTHPNRLAGIQQRIIRQMAGL